MNVIIFFIILLVLVIAHEFGHFFAAKKFGIRVDEFGFGFPPKIAGIKKGETEYTFNALPFGGFVKIFGENPDEDSLNGPDKDRSFVNKPRWKQAIVLFAGVFANFVVAWLLFSVGFMSGLPTSVDSVKPGDKLTDVNLVVVSVAPNTPAEEGGLMSGDKIISVKSGEQVLSPINTDTMKKFIVAHDKKEINISYQRGKTETLVDTKVTPKKVSSEGDPMIGISMDEIGISKLSFFGSLGEGMKLTWNVTKATVSGLYDLIRDGIMGKGSFASVTGPVGMVGIVGDAYDFGFVYLLSFAALISINLAVINLIPFPALDGGRLFFLLIEKIKGSRISTNFANIANTIGFAILILLMLVITYKDIVKLL